MNQSPFARICVAVRGGGDLGSGVAYRLHRCGFPVLITELKDPLLLRRSVSFGSAVLQTRIAVEGVIGECVSDLTGISNVQAQGNIPVIVDPEGATLGNYAPTVLIDARMLKGLSQGQPIAAPLTIGLGPGFVAPDNCDAVVETNRGHHLGRVIRLGAAQADTGLPARVLDRSADRVLRAPCGGILKGAARIGEPVAQGQIIASVDNNEVAAPFAGVLRGLVHDGVEVEPGMKIADIDPRGDPSYCFTISEKALAVGGGVLEAVLSSPAVRGRIGLA